MLKNLDPAKETGLSKEEYKKQIDELTIDLGVLQRKVKEAKIPVIIAFDGWEAAGKGTQINKLLQTLDPRGYNVYMGMARNEDEKLRPYWWRFWTRTPAQGRMAIYDKSWCHKAINQIYEKESHLEKFVNTCNQINAFERQITDGGTLIIKLFLHVSSQEQKKRLNQLAENKNSAWRVSDIDWEQNENYDRWLDAAQMTMERTDTKWASWNIVESDNHKYATLKIFSIVAAKLEEALAQNSRECETLQTKENQDNNLSKTRPNLTAMKTSVLDTVDLSLSLSKETYSQELDQLQTIIGNKGYEMYAKRKAMMVMYEGWDAAGKGGNIKRLTSNLDPRGYDVIPIGAPTEIEGQHHYLWRFWNVVPKAGHIAIFDRTWYGRVLVERVEGFCSKDQWKRAYQEINEIEEQLAESEVGIVKFWLHIDKDEQLRRFKEREETPWKTWKITDEDWRNREKWDQYYEAVDEMLLKTSTSYAPWTVIEANDKYYARIKALRTVSEKMKTLTD